MILILKIDSILFILQGNNNKNKLRCCEKINKIKNNYITISIKFFGNKIIIIKISIL